MFNFQWVFLPNVNPGIIAVVIVIQNDFVILDGYFVIVIVIKIGKSLNDFVILDGYMKTHSGDPPGESECIGRKRKMTDIT